MTELKLLDRPVDITALPLLHFSAKPLSKVRSVKQRTGHQADGDKPAGLWFSVGDGEDGWRSWCEAESFGLGCFKHSTEIKFKPSARVLRVSGADGIMAFDEQYGCIPEWAKNFTFKRRGINWERVAQDHDAILIAPYCWELRLSDIRWYYTWDVASGCVWNADAIETLTAHSTRDREADQ